MTISFYKTLSRKEKVVKELEFLSSVQCKFLSDVDIVNPTLVLSDIPAGANYCFIDSLKRYYFIENITVLNNGRACVNLSCDVLYTYFEEISESTAEVVECDSALNLNKSSYDGELTDTVTEIEFDNPFNASSDVLITVQGGTR